MKPLLWPAAFLAVAGGVFAPRPAEKWTVVIMGDTKGYLSPCGCTSPMTGGIVRRAQSLSGLNREKSLVLDMGRLAGGISRQDQIKAEALAEAMAYCRADAALLTAEDLQNGPGFAANLANLGKFTWLGRLQTPDGITVQTEMVKGPFKIATDDPTVPGTIEPGTNIVLTSGGADRARQLAHDHPSLRLVAYRSSSLTTAPTRTGQTLLVSCGEKGKALVRAEWSAGKFSTASGFELGPRFDTAAPSPAAQEVAGVFRRYLRRIEGEKLVEALPREQTAEFAGSRTCAPCHATADAAWRKSDHAHALKTLETKGQARDPECLPCHVVGLGSTVGFKDRTATPDLADVGCESCHGPLKAHADKPASNKAPKVSAQSCAPCHNLEHSPAFSFDRAWPKIAH